MHSELIFTHDIGICQILLFFAHGDPIAPEKLIVTVLSPLITFVLLLNTLCKSMGLSLPCLISSCHLIPVLPDLDYYSLMVNPKVKWCKLSNFVFFFFFKFLAIPSHLQFPT